MVIACAHHKKIDLGYIACHEMAQRRTSQRYTQVKCSNCGLYLFPDELNEPDNEKSQRVIENHNKYLEKHPKAKSVINGNA